MAAANEWTWSVSGGGAGKHDPKAHDDVALCLKGSDIKTPGIVYGCPEKCPKGMQGLQYVMLEGETKSTGQFVQYLFDADTGQFPVFANPDPREDARAVAKVIAWYENNSVGG